MSSNNNAAAIQALMAKKMEDCRKREEAEAAELERLGRELAEVQAREEEEWRKKAEAAEKKKAAVEEKKAQERIAKSIRLAKEGAAKKRKRVVESEEEDEDNDDDDDEVQEAEGFIVLVPPCARCREKGEMCMKEMGGKGTSCAQCARMKKSCQRDVKGKGKEKGEEKKRQVKKKAKSTMMAEAQAEAEADPSRTLVSERSDLSITSATWRIAETLENIQADLRTRDEYMVAKIYAPFYQLGKEISNTLGTLCQVLPEVRDRVDRVDRGVGTEEDKMEGSSGCGSQTVGTEAEVGVGEDAGDVGGEDGEGVDDADVDGNAA
jgi:hypothetical protein